MSDKAIPKKKLAVDTSVARAASGEAGTHPDGKNCREVLKRIRSICHQIVMTSTLHEEWKKHASTFSSIWLAAMRSMDKLQLVASTEDPPICDAIKTHAPNAGARDAMLKDVHLLESASFGDGIIVSCDDTVRDHFGRLAAHDESVADVIWANPRNSGEDVVAWLERGAPAEKHRRIRK